MSKRFSLDNRPGIASLIDHTLLKADASTEDIKKLCGEAKKFGFYSVCVNPSNIALCRRLLRGSRVRICAVVGFPLGSSTASVKEFEARDAAGSGADEIDMVANIGALKSGNFGLVSREIDLVRKAVRGKVLKVIIETGLLTKKEKVKACLIAKRAGADFVKTSTGFVSGPARRRGGAAQSDVRLLRRTVGSSMGVKASGGIKTARILLEMLAAGASRIGTSSGTSIMKNCRKFKLSEKIKNPGAN